MWLEIFKWTAITLGGGGIVFLLTRFYEGMRPPRGDSWHDQVDRHIQEADALIERFITLEQRLRGLEREVSGNQALAMEERHQILASIGDLHQKLDKLMERLLDMAAARA